jgi:hypothetical protein
MKSKYWLYLTFLFTCITITEIVLYAKATSFDHFIGRSPFSARLGETESLSPPVIELRNLIEKNKITELSVDKSIRKDEELFQRINEFLCPVKIKKNSEMVAGLGNYEINSNLDCLLIEKGDYVQIFQCR